MAKWTLDIGQYAKKQEQKLLDVRKMFVFALYNSITTKNPVDTGRSRANWNVSENEPDYTTFENKDKHYELKYNNVEQLPINAKSDESLFIANALPYIRRLEYGYSKQAPNGMVGVTLAGADNLLEEIVRGIQ